MLQNKVPNVRFCKYLDIWKTTKLKKIAEIIGGGTPDTKQLSYWNGGINWFSPTEVGKTVYLTKSEKTISQLGLQKSSAKLLPAFKTILFTSRAGIGDVGILTEESATNQGFQSLVVNEETDVYFLYSYSDQIKKYALKHSAGSTFLEISGKELGKMDLSIPSLPEQQAIGSLFHTIDDLLASYKDNLANYQSLKVTMLSKMFPKAGQAVPEIRLDGFEGEWKIKELGKVIKFYSGLTYKPSDVLSSGTLVLRSSNVREGELIYTDNVFVNPGIINCENVKLGDIVVVVRNGSRDLIGKHALIKSEMPNTVIGAFMTGIRCDNPEFINALLDTKMFIYEINRNLGSTINQITTGNFKRMKFYFPSRAEQQAIGSYFSNLDNLINSHQEKITQLETLKKKLLQDMFI